jgi:hypothetical protein
MARKKGGATSKSSYWRGLFRANPGLLKIRDNSALRNRWEADHPGQTFDKSWNSALSNVKSLMRTKRRKGGRPKKEVTVDGGAAKLPAVTHAALERLEISIDHCLAKARELETSGLDRAVKLLRAARNEVVWKSGQQQ